MVIGDDSCSRDRGFESQHLMLDGHYFTLTCSKNYIVCLLDMTENKRKRGRGWPIEKSMKQKKNGGQWPLNKTCDKLRLEHIS